MLGTNKQFFKNYNCWIESNTLRFRNMTNQRLVPEFINCVVLPSLF